MSTVAVLCTNHKSDPVPMLNGLFRQTRLPDGVLLESSGVSREGDRLIHTCDVPCRGDYELRYTVDDVLVPEENDYGYQKRNRMAERAKADWLAFWCHDDSYHPRYLELMMAAAEKQPEAEVVYCNYNIWPECRFLQRQSTVGNFIITRSLFHTLGGFWRKQRDNWGYADAAFIDAINERGTCVAHVPFTLYYHNVPFDPSVTATVWGIPTHSTPTDYKQWVSVTDRRLQDAGV